MKMVVMEGNWVLVYFRGTHHRVKLVRGEAEESKQNQGGFLGWEGGHGVDMQLKLETLLLKKGTGLAHLTQPKKQLLLMTELPCPWKAIKQGPTSFTLTIPVSILFSLPPPRLIILRLFCHHQYHHHSCFVAAHRLDNWPTRDVHLMIRLEFVRTTKHPISPLSMTTHVTMRISSSPRMTQTLATWAALSLTTAWDHLLLLIPPRTSTVPTSLLIVR